MVLLAAHIPKSPCAFMFFTKNKVLFIRRLAFLQQMVPDLNEMSLMNAATVEKGWKTEASQVQMI